MGKFDRSVNVQQKFFWHSETLEVSVWEGRKAGNGEGPEAMGPRGNSCVPSEKHHMHWPDMDAIDLVHPRIGGFFKCSPRPFSMLRR